MVIAQIEQLIDESLVEESGFLTAFGAATSNFFNGLKEDLIAGIDNTATSLKNAQIAKGQRTGNYEIQAGGDAINKGQGIIDAGREKGQGLIDAGKEAMQKGVDDGRVAMQQGVERVQAGVDYNIQVKDSLDATYDSYKATVDSSVAASKSMFNAAVTAVGNAAKGSAEWIQTTATNANNGVDKAIVNGALDEFERKGDIKSVLGFALNYKNWDAFKRAGVSPSDIANRVSGATASALGIDKSELMQYGLWGGIGLGVVAGSLAAYGIFKSASQIKSIVPFERDIKKLASSESKATKKMYAEAIKSRDNSVRLSISDPEKVTAIYFNTLNAVIIAIIASRAAKSKTSYKSINDFFSDNKDIYNVVNKYSEFYGDAAKFKPILSSFDKVVTASVVSA